MKILNRYRLFLLIVTFIFFITWSPSLLFIFPGIFFLYSNLAKKLSLSENLTYSILISMSYWIVSFWGLKFIPIHFSSYIYATFLISLFYLLVSKPPIKIRFQVKDLIPLIVACTFLILYLPILNQQIVPGGMDMATQAYIARIIQENNAFPQNYYPILPIDSFGNYPFGFSTLSAAISLIGNIPVYKSTLILTAISYPLLGIGMYLFLSKQFPQLISAITTFVVFFTGSEIVHYIAWGGNTTIFAIGIIAVTLALAISIYKNKLLNNKYIFLLSFLSYASFTTHQIPLVVALLLFIPAFIYFFIVFKKGGRDKLVKIAYYFSFIFIFSVPFLIGFKSPPEDTLSWIKEWHAQYWKGALSDAYITVPAFLRDRFGEPLFTFGLAGAFIVFVSKARIKHIYLASIVLLFVIIINSRYWVLPFSALFYPDRATTLFILPLSIFVASFFYLIHKMSNKIFGNILAYLFLVLIICFVPIYMHPTLTRMTERYRYFIKASRDFSLVSENDLFVMEWISNNTPQNIAILNKYTDAGIWIPAISFRKVLTNDYGPYHRHILKDYSKNISPTHLFIGTKSRGSTSSLGIKFKAEDWHLMYSKGDAKFYTRRSN